jgi:hypothetical protein
MMEQNFLVLLDSVTIYDGVQIMTNSFQHDFIFVYHTTRSTREGHVC